MTALLVACGGGGSSAPTPPTGIGTVAPRPTPTTSPAPSETPALETIAPERPAALGQPGVEGAEALARYFLELYGFVYATGDLNEWNRVSHPDCEFCAAVSEQVIANTTEKRTAEGGEVTVHELSTEQLTVDYASVRGIATQASATLRGSNGEVLTETKESTLNLAIGITRTGNGWLVHGLESLDEDRA